MGVRVRVPDARDVGQPLVSSVILLVVQFNVGFGISLILVHGEKHCPANELHPNVWKGIKRIESVVYFAHLK